MNKNKLCGLIAAATMATCVNSAVTVLADTQNNVLTIDSRTTLTGKVVNVGSSTLRIRSTASTSGAVLGTLKEGDTFTILGKSNGWYQIQVNGIKGYVSGDYVQEIANSSGSNNNNNNNNNNNGGSTTTSTTGKVVNVGSSTLRIRSTASTSGEVLGYMKEGETFTIVSKTGSWYKIVYKNITGYIHGDYVEEISGGTVTPPTEEKPSEEKPTETPDTVITFKGQVYNTGATGLNLREKPNETSTVLVSIPEGTKVDIVAKNGNWYKTTYAGKTGYVSATYIKEVTEEDSGEQEQSIFDRVYEIMKAQVGSPYVWGGTGEFITDELITSLKIKFPVDAANGYYDKIEPKYINSGYRAFDCSGLMQWGFGQVGIKLNRVVASQINNGVEVSLSDVKPGDLLFNSSLTHVGMYVGGDKWIESPRPGEYVRIVSVPWSQITRARRVIN